MKMIVKTVLGLLGVAFFLMCAFDSHAATEMTCDNFMVQKAGVQEAFLSAEITGEVLGFSFVNCIERNIKDARTVVATECSHSIGFSNALATASRRIRTACMVEGSDDSEFDEWDSIEIPFSEFRKP